MDRIGLHTHFPFFNSFFPFSYKMRFALFSFVIAALSGIQQAVSLPYQKLDSSSSLDSSMYKCIYFSQLVFLNSYSFLETLNTLILVSELENLEVAFYSKALNQFNATQFNASISALALRRYQEILEHEQTYVKLLQNFLGPSWPQPCTYNLYVFFSGSFETGGLIFFAWNSSFQTVEEFLSLSLVLESIGEFLIFTWW